jgi:Tol biopolymer transport system component
MGEVYRARDTRLGRDVAIKVLPAGLASDPDRLKRFEREARSASSLNHPNIVTIYDIGSADSISYIAMELVEGDSLRTLMLGGALPARRLLEIAVQAADGLAKAHAAGIVHRDLKPENVMVTEDRHVKILDFGLAKLTQPEMSASGATQGPTVSGETEPGMVMGTMGYMSPEQALGKQVDSRSDQFSLGAILYEMATGRRAFQRGSAPQTLTAIIQEEPEPIAGLNAKIPAPVRWIIDRCLAKEPRSRYTSTDDLAKELATVRDRLSEATSAVGMLPAEPVRAARRRWWIPAAIAAAILLGLGIAVWRLRQSDSFWKNPLANARFTRFTDWEGSERDASVSADGRFVAFIADRSGIFDAWVGQVGGGEFLNLSNGRYSELANPFVRAVGFTDDGAHVSLADLANRILVLIPTMGGEPRPFMPKGVSAAWSRDGKQVLYHTSAPGDPVFVADGGGQNPRQIYVGKSGIHNHYPAWSPDGRFVYFVSGLAPYDMDLFRISTSGGVPDRLTHSRSSVAFPAFLDDRTLIYVAPDEDGSMRLYAMDVNRRIPHRVGLGVEEYLSVSASSDGRRLVATVANPTHLLWTVPISDRVAQDSDLSPLKLSTTHAGAPRFGPGYILYLSSRGGPNGLWKLEKGSEIELWKGGMGAVSTAPAVSRDGSKIAFVVRRHGRGILFIMASDGTGTHPLAEALDVRDTPSWSADGKWIAVVAREADSNRLFSVPVEGGEPVRLADGVLFDPVWSPDGRFILYSDGTQGGATVTIRALTPNKEPWKLPELPPLGYGSNRYRFLPDGKSLVLMKGLFWQQSFWIVDLSTGRLRQLTNFGPQSQVRSFDVSPDGKEILVERYRGNSDIALIDLPPR